MRSKEKCAFTDNPVVYFDGSELSFLKADFPDQMMAGNLTVTIFIKPETPMEGVVLDYVASPANPDGVSRMTITLNGGIVTLEMRNKLGEHESLGFLCSPGRGVSAIVQVSLLVLTRESPVHNSNGDTYVTVLTSRRILIN